VRGQRFHTRDAKAAARAALAQRKVAEHKLDGWRVRYGSARTVVGLCDYASKTIRISRMYLWSEETSDESFLDTVLHEIAHALVGPGKGHGPEWKAAAASVGCSGERLVDTEHLPHRYHVTCPCGQVDEKRHRVDRIRKARMACKKCKGELAIRGL